MSQRVSRISDKSSSSSYTIQQTAHEESWKLQYDIYKHLTTLSTGSILLLITFLEKLFTRPTWKWLVPVALCCLLASILVSFVVMNLMASQVREMEVDQRFVKRNLIVIIIALSTFLLGIFSLIVFAVKNLL
jgi:F0F1-type ATP synthase membrane subunit c/vacuolar-type H+-ATPase subunit K